MAIVMVCFYILYHSTTANKHAEFVQHIFKHAEFFRVFAKLALRIFSACFVWQKLPFNCFAFYSTFISKLGIHVSPWTIKLQTWKISIVHSFKKANWRSCKVKIFLLEGKWWRKLWNTQFKQYQVLVYKLLIPDFRYYTLFYCTWIFFHSHTPIRESETSYSTVNANELFTEVHKHSH